jgi:cytidylate kinase
MAIITVSRGSFSGGKEVAEKVAKNLGYKCVSREDLIHDAAEYGIDEKNLDEVLKKPPSFWDSFKKPRRQYLTFIRAALLEEAMKADIVYHGNLGHFLIGEEYPTLKVKLIANMAFRVERAMNENNMSQEEAVNYIRRIDEKRIKWARFLYNTDWNDPYLYDLVINLHLIDIVNAVKTIEMVAKEKVFKNSEVTKNKLKRLHTGSKVEVALLMHDNTSQLLISVNCPKDSVIELRGDVESTDFRNSVMDVVRNVEGVKEVIDKMGSSFEEKRYSSWS